MKMDFKFCKGLNAIKKFSKDFAQFHWLKNCNAHTTTRKDSVQNDSLFHLLCNFPNSHWFTNYFAHFPIRKYINQCRRDSLQFADFQKMC